MKILSYVLAALLVALQYPLWLGKGSWMRVWELDRGKGLGERADLVHLDQYCVGHALADRLAQDARVGNEDVVADDLQLPAQTSGQRLPALPVVLRHPVLDRDDRIACRELLEVSGEFCRCVALALGLQSIAPVFEKLRCRAI